jgi:hypothetical protein
MVIPYISGILEITSFGRAVVLSDFIVTPCNTYVNLLHYSRGGNMVQMATDKQLLGIRLDQDVIKRIDDVTEKLAAPAAAPSRNVMLTKVIMDWLEQAERDLNKKGLK